MTRPVVLLAADELEAHAFNRGFALHNTPDYMWAVVDNVEFRAYFVSEVTC